MKVDNAGAKHISATDYGIGDKSVPTTLQAIDKLTVEHVEVEFSL
jgi:hypothetical protein